MAESGGRRAWVFVGSGIVFSEDMAVFSPRQQWVRGPGALHPHVTWNHQAPFHSALAILMVSGCGSDRQGPGARPPSARLPWGVSGQVHVLCFSFVSAAVCLLVFEFGGIFMFSGYKFFTHLVGKGFLLAWGLSFGSLTVFSFDEVLLMLFLSPFCVMLWVSKPFVYDSEVFLIFFQNVFF